MYHSFELTIPDEIINDVLLATGHELEPKLKLMIEVEDGRCTYLTFNNNPIIQNRIITLFNQCVTPKSLEILEEDSVLLQTC